MGAITTGKVADAKDEPDIASMNLWQKLAAITGEVGSIAKDGKNREQGYAFIEYGAVAGALRTLFGKYHVMCIPTMGERHEDVITTARGGKGYHVLIDFTFTFINGDKPEEKQEIRWTGEATDYGDKATNKAATSALKYCLMRTFNVSEKGELDADATTPEPAKEIQKVERPGANGYATEKQRKEISRVLTLRGLETVEQQQNRLREMGEELPLTVGAASRVLDQLKGDPT
jgi:hypothetical protein